MTAPTPNPAPGADTESAARDASWEQANHEDRLAKRREIDALRARVAELERLDLESERSCPRCNGKGLRMYASTAVWTGAAGGQALTRGVCDRCWGTGNEQEPGINGRELVAAKREVKRLRARVAELEGLLPEAFRAGAAYATGSHADFTQTHPDCEEWVRAALAATINPDPDPNQTS